MKFPWNKPKPDPLRPIVLGNLARLQRLFNSRGRRFNFNESAPTDRLETGLWEAVGQCASEMSLSFSPQMPLEHRISEIERNLEPLARNGSPQGSAWPGWLQAAR